MFDVSQKPPMFTVRNLKLETLENSGIYYNIELFNKKLNTIPADL